MNRIRRPQTNVPATPVEKTDEAATLSFFAVRNREGKWFHRKGYGGYGDTWVDKLRSARIYNKIGYARGQASFFTSNYPQYGTPDIVEFVCTETRVINPSAQIAAARAKADRREAVRQQRIADDRLRIAREAKARADRDLAAAEAAAVAR